MVTYEEYKQGASLYQRAWSQLLQHQTFGTWIRTHENLTDSRNQTKLTF